MRFRTLAAWGISALLLSGIVLSIRSGDDATDARTASYSEKPPAQYLGPFTARLAVLGDVNAVSAACRAMGFVPPAGGYLVACTKDGTIYAPDPCAYRGFYSELICHEAGHVSGWGPEHDRGPFR